uniref:Uncharacterized protein n=1 Tax=Ascaris lumbricoides TaxID=6252 RepID=A0A0M3IUJ6_ASCLU
MRRLNNGCFIGCGNINITKVVVGGCNITGYGREGALTSLLAHVINVHKNSFSLMQRISGIFWNIEGKWEIPREKVSMERRFPH